MKPITITLEPPITEYCTSCDYEDSYSFTSIRLVCPKCGAPLEVGSRGPAERAVSLTKTRGRYNLADPSQKEWAYTFHNVPGFKRESFIVDEEIESHDPLEVALELQEIYSHYLYCPSKEKIDAIVKILESEEEQERQRKLRFLEQKKHLENQLYRLIWENQEDE